MAAARWGRSAGASCRPAAALLLLSGLLALADAHGFLSYPVPRNWKARTDINNETFYCPHCLAAGGPGTVQQYVNTWPSYETEETAIRHGLCGDAAAESPQRFLATSDITATFEKGSTVTFEVVVTAPHMGHFEFRLCNLDELRDAGGGDTVTQTCLNANVLQRRDSGDEISPVDTRDGYTHRYYSDPSCASSFTSERYAGTVDGSTDYVNMYFPGAQKMRMQYELPAGLTCSHCVLQWYWVTGNTCTPPGYQSGIFPTGNLDMCYGNVSEYSWWAPGLATCGDSYPEEFWNCADIAIVDSSRAASAGDADEVLHDAQAVPAAPVAHGRMEAVGAVGAFVVCIALVAAFFRYRTVAAA